MDILVKMDHLVSLAKMVAQVSLVNLERKEARE